MQTPEETKTALIVVRTYPVPAKTGVEVSCTAAITNDGKWLRLFPVPWRYLATDQQFRRYNWVELRVRRATKDPRPESYKLAQDGVKIIGSVGTKESWAERKKSILPLSSHCLCCLIRERDEYKFPTLGIFKPRSIKRLIIADDEPNWTQGQLEILRQENLFVKAPKNELEKIPFKFQYEFLCEDQNCFGHTLSCTDWEMAQSWRVWKRKYGDKWEEKFRQRYEREMIEKYDTSFYVGTIHQHPNRWIIVGLFYPPKDTRPAPLPQGQYGLPLD